MKHHIWYRLKNLTTDWQPCTTAPQACKVRATIMAMNARRICGEVAEYEIRTTE